MKRIYPVLLSLVLIGGLSGLLAVRGQTIGDIKNVVQTIKNVVIVSPSTGDPIIDINPLKGAGHQMGPNDTIYVKPGAFRDGSIALEDIDWNIFPNGAGCDSDFEVIQSIDSSGQPKCVNISDYRSPVTDQQDGAIYYAKKVAISTSGQPISHRDFGNASFMVGNPSEFNNKLILVDGGLKIGSNDQLTVSKENNKLVVDSTTNKIAFMPGSPDESVIVGGVGSDPLGSNPKALSLRQPTHSLGLEMVDNAKQTNIQASSNNIASITPYNNLLYVGNTSVKNSPIENQISFQDWIMDHAHAAGTVASSRVYVGDGAIPTLDSLGNAVLTVDGQVSTRGAGQRGGVRFSNYTNASPAANLQDHGCKVLSVDATGKVVLKQVPAAQCSGVTPPSITPTYAWECAKQAGSSCSGTYTTTEGGQCVGDGYYFNDDLDNFGCSGPCGQCRKFSCSGLSEDECKNPSLIQGKSCGSFQCSRQDIFDNPITHSCMGLTQSQCGTGEYSTCKRNFLATSTAVCKDNQGNIVDDSYCAGKSIPKCGENNIQSCSIVGIFDGEYVPQGGLVMLNTHGGSLETKLDINISSSDGAAVSTDGLLCHISSISFYDGTNIADYNTSDTGGVKNPQLSWITVGKEGEQLGRGPGIFRFYYKASMWNKAVAVSYTIVCNNQEIQELCGSNYSAVLRQG